MGELTLWEKVLKFFKEEFNFEAALERLMDGDTLKMLIVGSVGLGLIQWTEIEASSFEKLAWGMWSLWMAGRNKNKAIKKILEETPPAT